MASDLFRLVDFAERSLVQVVNTADSILWLQEKVAGGNATEKEQSTFIKLFDHALKLQKLVDDLKVTLDEYVLLADHDFARLGLTNRKSDIVKSFLEVAETRPFAPYVELFESLGKPSLLSPSN